MKQRTRLPRTPARNSPFVVRPTARLLFHASLSKRQCMKLHTMNVPILRKTPRPVSEATKTVLSCLSKLTVCFFNNRVATGQGKVREFCAGSGKFEILRKVREL